MKSHVKIFFLIFLENIYYDLAWLQVFDYLYSEVILAFNERNEICDILSRMLYISIFYLFQLLCL